MKKITVLAALLASALMSAQPAPGSFEQSWKPGPDWLKNGVIYQVYPSSYKDSDGNGIGDWDRNRGADRRGDGRSRRSGGPGKDRDASNHRV